MASAHSRRLGYAVACAEDVIAVTLRAVHRHLACIETDAMGAHKFGIIEILGDHHIGHGAHHGRIGAGTDGDPLIGQGGALSE